MRMRTDKTIIAAALFSFAAWVCPVVAHAAPPGTWSDCGQIVDFDGVPETRSRTGGPKGIRLDYLQLLKQPDLLEQAYCFPGEVGSADDMWLMQDALASDARLKGVQGNVAAIPGGWLYVGSGVGRDANGREMRVEFQCRSLKKYVACLSVAGPKSAFPRKTADKFFGSIRPLAAASKQTSEVNAGVAKGLASAGIYSGREAAIEALAQGKPWEACVPQVMSRQRDYSGNQPISGITSLKQRKTDLGKKFVLLLKREDASQNSLVECELSNVGDFIGLQGVSR